MNEGGNVEPSEVLKPEALQEYRVRLDRIGGELYRLNSNLYVLGKLLGFPTDLILGPDRNTFFRLVQGALARDSILVVTKLLTDDGEGSMRWLSNFVGKNMKAEHQTWLKKSLPKDELNKATELARQKKLKYFRDNIIAHDGKDPQTRTLVVPNTNFMVSMEDLHSICEAMNRYFDVLCLGEPIAVLPLSYILPPPGHDNRSDIEHILALIVKDSAFYKAPSEPWWADVRPKWPQWRIDILNEYRRMFGEPDV